MFKFIDSAQSTRLLLEYSTELFQQDSIRRMLRQFAALAQHFLRTPRAQVGTLALGDDIQKTEDSLAEEW